MAGIVGAGCAAVLIACGHGVTSCDASSADMGSIPWQRLSGLIAYAKWQDPTSTASRGCLFLIDVSARRVRVVRDVATKSTPSGQLGWARDLAFRRDGSTITFAVQSAPSGFWELHDLSLASGDESTLFPVAQGHHNYPSWSPAGRLAYYSNGPDGAYEAVDGGFLFQGSDPGRVAWTADEKLIATFATNTSPGDLYVADPSTGTQAPLVTSVAGEIYDQPAISADGTKIAYVRRGPGPAGSYEEEVWVANADGQGQRRLTTGSDDAEPAWSADGRSVLFSRFNDGIFLYDLDSGSVTRITSQTADSIAWIP